MEMLHLPLGGRGPPIKAGEQPPCARQNCDFLFAQFGPTTILRPDKDKQENP